MTIHAPEPGADASAAPVRSERDLTRLLRLSSHGNELAFAEFYDATVSRVLGLALRMGLDVARAERITEEVFLHAWLHSARYQPRDGQPLTWLLRIAHRKSVELLRVLRS